MIDFVYFKYLTELLFNQCEKGDELAEEKLEVLKYFWRYANQFESKKLKLSLIIRFLEKKADMILNAKTKSELKEIKKISVPVYSHTENKLVPSGIFHSEEEELLLWATFTASCMPNTLGYERYQELFEKLYNAEE